MSERMTDERLAKVGYMCNMFDSQLEGEMFTNRQNLNIELLQALKAERERIAELEALTGGTCEKHPHLNVPVGCICHYCLDEERRKCITELEATIEKQTRQITGLSTNHSRVVEGRDNIIEKLQATIERLDKIPETVSQFKLIESESVGPLYTAGYNDGMQGVVNLINKALADKPRGKANE